MKIILSGNHNLFFYNSVQCREKALRELGHEVIFFDERASFLPGLIRRVFAFTDIWSRRQNARRLVRLAKAEKPDVFLAVGGFFEPEALAILSSLGVRTVLWTTDVPGKDAADLLRCAPYYDHVFCSGSEALELFSALTLRRPPQWLPFACDPELHRPGVLEKQDRERYHRSLVFVGSHYPNRQQTLESVMDLDLGVWGPGWNRACVGSALGAWIEGRGVNYDEWIKIYAAADIVLVVHFQDGKQPCYQASPKLFEALACGAFVLCDDQKDVRKLFVDGEHLVLFSSPQELREKACYYLERPQERQRIARQGQQAVLHGHTYQDRLKTLFSILGRDL